MNNNLKVIGGFLAGAAIGAATGLLMAPASGKKTRRRMLNESKRLADELVESATKKIDSVKELYNHKNKEYAKSH